MDLPLFTVPAFLNHSTLTKTLLDDGCSAYAMISRKAARKAGLSIFPLPRPIGVKAFSDSLKGHITEIAAIDQLDIGGSMARQGRVWAYVVPKLQDDFDLILGRPWRKHEDVWIDPRADTLHIRRTGVKLSNQSMKRAKAQLNILQISAVAYARSANTRQRKKGVEVFAASLADIEKALKAKSVTDPRAKLPECLHEFLPTFDRQRADQLPPFRPGVDHKIELESKDGQKPEVPAGPLYGMSREMLLVLRKTLTELLDKGFIRVSSSPAAAPVLFVKKPGGGLRFCVDYRALNAITRKDRYPLPLIRETLQQISRARWFTKLDVIAAFNKIRIAEGDEWMTAFTTRFGLFEWLVTPFGLSNAPATFQRFINSTLREYLGHFVSAYVDDVLIYTDGSKEDHYDQVRKVLTRLQSAGLQLDIDKCEFAVQTTKYLGFMISAGKGISMDPEKLKAIEEWARPTTVKGMRGFIGFANFYRTFIRDFSKVTAPLHAAVKQYGTGRLEMGREAIAAFEFLKKAFATAPILLQYDEKRQTVVESDASGWVTGGALLQYDDDGILRPVAYHSKKMTPAECNYEIHDKELLAIIRCFEEWHEYLVPLESFVVRTDHNNLRYFSTKRKLSERQARWSLALSQYNYQLEYKPGSLNALADALSRRDQDLPKGESDERVQGRYDIVLKPAVFPQETHQEPTKDRMVHATPVHAEDTYEIRLGRDLEAIWTETERIDPEYQDLIEMIEKGHRHLPEQYRHLRLQPSQFRLHDGKLMYEDRYWVPNSEPLRTSLVQEAHDSVLSGHPGKNATIGILRRRWYWPGITRDVSQFIKACDSCGRNTVWRSRRQGLLRPLPVPERTWSEISMDYVTEMPATARGNRHILVITDRLSKGAIFIPVPDLEGNTLARKFIEHYVGYHGLPNAIVSDRGDQFVKGIWSFICKILKIKQRLSTAYHPETDGSTERMNQVLEEILRHFCNYQGDDWDTWLPIAQLAVLGRESTATGVSSFFLSHGYHPNIGSVLEWDNMARPNPTNRRNPAAVAEETVTKLKNCVELAQATMASAQQRMEDIQNRKRDPAPAYHIGDQVWLNLKNIKRHPTRKKKLTEQHQKFRVTEVIGSHAYRLNTPGGQHNVFHTSLLRPATGRPLPSQIIDDYQPEPASGDDGDQEYEIEQVLDDRVVRGRGRGGPLHREFLCKWTGYVTPEWTHADWLEDAAALDEYEARTGRKISQEPLVLPSAL
jgi:transposase InsO family protein